MSATSRYWESPTAGMTPDMAAGARRNLMETDRSISRFNDRAKYFATQTAPISSPISPSPVPTSSFQFGLNSSKDASQLSLSGIPSTNAVSRIASVQNNNGQGTSVMSEGRVGDTFSDMPHQGQGIVLHPWETGYSDESRRRGITSSAPPEHREQYGWGQ